MRRFQERELALLGAAVVAVPVFQRLGLGSVLGYLVAGVLVGPWGLGVIDQVDEMWKGTGGPEKTRM